jgi:hypothetical protein
MIVLLRQELVGIKELTDGAVGLRTAFTRPAPKDLQAE